MDINVLILELIVIAGGTLHLYQNTHLVERVRYRGY